MKKIIVLLLCASLLLCSCGEGDNDISFITPPVAEESDISLQTSADQVSQGEVSDEQSEVQKINHFKKGETVLNGNLKYDFSPDYAQPEFDTLVDYVKSLYTSGTYQYPVSIDGLPESYSGKATDRFAFVYIDLQTGCSLSYGVGKQYQTCSVIKPSLAVQMLKAGVDLTEEIKITSNSGGSGVLTSADIGKSYTVEYLMEIMITESDNTAYNHLLRRNGKTSQQEFADYLKAIGTETINVGSPNYWKFGLITEYDLAVMMRDIYNYSLENENGKKVLNWMQRTSYNDLISSVGNIPVAHKYGEDTGIEPSLHDGAIYLGEFPYVLVILSTSDYKSEETYCKFKELAVLVNEFHSAMHDGADNMLQTYTEVN